MKKTVLISIPIEHLQEVIVDCVNSCLERNRIEHNRQNIIVDDLLTVGQTAKFLSLSILTIYSKVNRGEIPFMKRSKRLYFSKVELLDYLKKGRVKSNQQIEAEAEEYLGKKKGGEK